MTKAKHAIFEQSDVQLWYLLMLQQLQSSTEQSWGESHVQSVCSRRCCLTGLQPAWKPAGSSVHARFVRESALIPKTCHSDHIKALLVLAVALQGTPTVTLRDTNRFTEMKPVACSDFNVQEWSPDRHQPLHSQVLHRSCFQWWGRHTR